MPDEPELSFEQRLQKLESIVERLEASDLTLDESLRLFEEGVGLSDTCRKMLEEAETKVEKLVAKQGVRVPEPFELDDGAD